MKRCQFCHKKLKRKTFHYEKWGKKVESLFNFNNRKFCDHSCQGKQAQLNVGHQVWDKKSLEKHFRKNFDKYGACRERWPHDFRGNIRYHFGSWTKFLHEIGVDPVRDYSLPHQKRTVSYALKYLREEIGAKPREIFELPMISLIGIGNIHSRQTARRAIQTLVDMGKLKLVKKMTRSLRPTDYDNYDRFYLTS